MEAKNTTFQGIINGVKQFLIPVFQRDYKWSDGNWQELWDDISGASAFGHFVGSIVHVQGSTLAAAPTYLVIDGQQRLATLTVFCAALRDHIKHTGWHGDGNGPTADQIDAYYIKNTLETGDRQYKLVLRRTDNETLRAVVDGKLQNGSNGDWPGLIDEAYQFFRGKLKDSKKDPGEIYRGIISLRIVEITLDRNVDNPQSVFESMNSTGVDLSQSDLVRNYLLMELDEPEQTRLYNEYWRRIEVLFRTHDSALDSFIRDYIALKQRATRQARQDRIYEEFKGFRCSMPEDKLEELLREMVRFAGYYARFRGLVSEPSERVSRSLGNVRYHGDTTATLIMRLYDCREQGRLTEKDFTAALDVVESYLIRRAVANSQTRSYWDVFAGFTHRIDDQRPLDSLLHAMERQQGTYSFPMDDSFRSSLQERELYRLRVCKQFLSRLENHGEQEPSPTGTYSIEHIMPQNDDLNLEWQHMLGENWQEIHRVWLHRLGNLTLTAYNSRYSDRPFEEKKTIPGGFNQSAVRLNQFVKEQASWTTAEMEERGRILANRALEIWQFLQPDQEYVEEVRIRELRAREASTNVLSIPMNDRLHSVFNSLHQEINNMEDGIIAVQERNSACYYSRHHEFFLEVLPQQYGLKLLLDFDISEVDDPQGMAKDANEWKFIPLSTHSHSYGVVVDVGWVSQIESVMPMVRQAHEQATIERKSEHIEAAV